MSKRTPLVYGLLIVVWGMIVAWQALEHDRVKESARTALLNRSRDIADIVSGVIESATFRGILPQVRLESALNKIVKPGELMSVALLNVSDEVVASVGKPIDLEKTGMMQERVRWGQNTLTFVKAVNPVDVSSSGTPERGTNYPIIVQPPRPPSTNSTRESGRGFSRRDPRPADTGSSNTLDSASTNRDERAGSPRGRGGRPPFGGPRPFWMDEKEWQSLVEKRGLHGLVMVMSTESLQASRIKDLWLRCIIGAFAGVSVAGFGLAWQNLVKSSELQMRLLRASELNSHLKGMNVAAAGLAHETRNPLNIIRGLAQMISKEPSASPEIRTKSSEITGEVDRVTAQLNEFINYSRPREVRRAPVGLSSVIGDVARALQSDIEDKAVQLKTEGDNLIVDADEQLLRQVLFNLLINAVQAVEPNGEIQIVSRRCNSIGAQFEIRDNGPGVPAEHRHEIFKPYFTTHQRGTGLGLAVVQQIALAHGWDIEFVPNEPKGAIFRLSGLKLSSKT